MRSLKSCGYLLLVATVLFLTFCQRAEIKITHDQTIQNLHAFTKLYGYVRFFHPSDQASLIDWDRFAIYGSEKVINATTTDELKAVLKELFKPIGPTIQIYSEGENPESVKIPENTDSLGIIAWQHLGVGLGSSSGIYKSTRLNREKLVTASQAGFGTLTQSLGAWPLRGKEIKMTAYVRSEVSGSGNAGQLWLRVDRENNQMGFFDNMDDRPIQVDTWKEYEIMCEVAKDATNIYFGCFLNGMGKVWVDDFKLYFKNDTGEWESIDINNPGFEKENNGNPVSWNMTSPGYTYLLTTDKKWDGEKCLLIENKGVVFKGMLFNEYPKMGEVINKELCDGLYCQVPLALLDQHDNKTSKKNTKEFDHLMKELKAIGGEELSANNEYVRIGNIVIAWNVFQHFYPYFNVINVDWNEQLTDFLEEVLTNQNEKDFYNTLKKMVTSIRDGHGGVYHKMADTQAGFNIQVDWIEDQVVITYSKDTAQFKTGDIVVLVDEIPAEQILQEEEAYISGSDQWKRFRSLSKFGYGEQGTVADIKILRNGEPIYLQATRNIKNPISAPRKSIYKIKDDVYYVNLDNTPMADINKIMGDLATARGVIFDLRGYPNRNHEVISHLLVEADTSGSWMQVPKYIYPDQEKIVGYQKHGWFIQPQKPHISGEVVFITDGRAISYAESFMGFIEHYRLAEIVGQPTAGTNGNVNFFNLPGGFRVTWTGMKVLKHNGSQHHLIGIQPTIPVQRTIKAVREGRDEFLEKAMEIIQ
jgi:C-terminal processing protease CtpA/Prc